MRGFYSGLVPGSLLFSRYELIRALSIRSEGAVYLCSDLQQQNRLVALKVCEKSLDDALVGRRFMNEYAISRLARHRNLVTAEEFYRDEAFYAFTMDYLAGGNLCDRLARTGELRILEVLRVLLQLCSGLSYLHKMNVLHRDIKLENVLLDDAGVAHLSDFSISWMKDVGLQDSKDTLIGTPRYLSPEYIASGDFDERSDLYSIGVLAFRLISGRFPFSAESPLKEMLSRFEMAPPSLNDICPECPEELSLCVGRCLEVSPSDRYQSAEELREDLLYVTQALSIFPDPRSTSEVLFPSDIRVAEGEFEFVH